MLTLCFNLKLRKTPVKRVPKYEPLKELNDSVSGQDKYLFSENVTDSSSNRTTPAETSITTKTADTNETAVSREEAAYNSGKTETCDNVEVVNSIIATSEDMVDNTVGTEHGDISKVVT